MNPNISAELMAVLTMEPGKAYVPVPGPDPDWVQVEHTLETVLELMSPQASSPQNPSLDPTVLPILPRTGYDQFFWR
jgi:hypothetical protein